MALFDTSGLTVIAVKISMWCKVSNQIWQHLKWWSVLENEAGEFERQNRPCCFLNVVRTEKEEQKVCCFSYEDLLLFVDFVCYSQKSTIKNPLKQCPGEVVNTGALFFAFTFVELLLPLKPWIDIIEWGSVNNYAQKGLQPVRERS